MSGSCTATLKKLDTKSTQWARLEDCQTSSVGDYLSELNKQSELTVEQKTYLFDWSIPIHCPRLAAELKIPKYFASK